MNSITTILLLSPSAPWTAWELVLLFPQAQG